jgi:hypothetical protein
LKLSLKPNHSKGSDWIRNVLDPFLLGGVWYFIYFGLNPFFMRAVAEGYDGRLEPWPEIFYGSGAASGLLRGDLSWEPVEGRGPELFEDCEGDDVDDGSERLVRFRVTSTL